jgi:Domain of unknown function (DUF4326)
MPTRLQCHRTKGWRANGAKIVTRASRWGNPFTIPPYDRETALRLFEEYARYRAQWQPAWLEPLRGKDLACVCGADQACHADVLLALANPTPDIHASHA